MIEIEDSIAEKIIARTKGLIPYDINVMNKQGKVVASTDASRLGREHEGARWVIEHQESVTVDSTSTRYLAGAKPGVNLPIEYHGQCIGVVGITGDPNKVCELGALLKMTAELLIEQSREKDAALQLSIEKENCVKQLLQGRDNTQALAQLKHYQLSLRLPAVCLTLKPTPQHYFAQHRLALTPALELMLNSLFCFNRDSMSVIVEQGSSMASKIAQLTNLIKVPFMLGVGTTVYSYQELALSQATANAALAHGMVSDAQVKDARVTSYYYEPHKEKIIINAVAQGWHLAELTKEYRALMAQDKNGVLRLTLSTLISSANDMGSCAQLLNIHRNTLRNRLEKIQALTGVNYKNLDQLFRLYLGKLILD
ncbi:sugar diacid recognition domain-containing protein [Oceanisphaera avium]|uniref:Sugar diacid utilization regulator n=1 Tax=Oceanisphaera avium TaxID=1903694 RepID=A0A1Y0CVB8_9GAMM|nr:sugar diacid recognition domain-containing protein [Oceanisphaera avium]ART79283.1 hypothetical protein CBP12_03250 [Oceanisphaera avium]